MIEVDCRDIGALRAQIAEEHGPWSQTFPVSQSVIDSFAELTGDKQWIHTDVERAGRESPYGGTVAHGFLILSLMPRIQPPRKFSIINHRSVANYGSGGFRFVSPVPAGSGIRSKQKLTAVDEHAKGVLLTYEVVIQAEDSDKPALVYSLLLLYRY